MTDRQKRDLLRLVWSHRLFADSDLLDTGGSPVHVESPGYAPEPSGADREPAPDFVQAAVRFGADPGGVILYGAVRVDGKASHWREQGRMTDPAFDSVVFHVVGERDRVLVRDGREVRTIVLEPAPEVEALYEDLLAQAQRGGVGCTGFFGGLEAVEQGQILSRLVADRLRRKAAEVGAICSSLGGDWDETAYVCYLRSLGMGDRKLSYEALARSIPLRCFVRCAGDVRCAEALLMGQSGYLTVASPSDPGIRQLQDIYLTLKEEYGLRRPVVSWARAGVRPVSLPPSMLSRAASLLVREPRLAERVRTAAGGGMETLRELFGGAEAGVSAQKVDLRIINFVIPLLTAIGREAGDAALQERALALYDEVAPEANRYTRQWSAGFEPQSAFDSQAVVQLCTEYCARERCAECPVGTLRLVRLWRGLAVGR